MNRRVSFASHASVRLFEKPGESPSQTTPRRSTRLSPAKSPIRDSGPASPLADEDSIDNLTMDLTNVVPRMPLMTRQTNSLAGHAEDEEDDKSEDSESDMEVAEDDTAAMELTDVLHPATTNQAKMSPFSRIPRRSISPLKNSPAVQDDDTMNMDMTAIVGKILPPAALAYSSQDSPGVDFNMDMTKVVGGILDAAQSLSASSNSHGILSVNLGIVNQHDNPEDHTMNMEETQIYSHNAVRRRVTVGSDDHTNHTSYTEATEEDDVQIWCEGSVTQADGFTQNMECAKAQPNFAQTTIRPKSPLGAAGVGFPWGSAPLQSEQSIMDVSMPDVTQEDGTVNVDMTYAIGTNILEQSMQPDKDADGDQTVNMDLTRAYSTVNQEIAKRTPRGTPSTTPVRSNKLHADDAKPPSTESLRSTLASRSTPVAIVTTPKAVSPSKISTPLRRLSSGAKRVMLPFKNNTGTELGHVLPSTPVRTSQSPSVRRSGSVARRKSLLETEIPVFGSPDAQVLLQPGSSQKPEFGANLIQGQDLRVSILKEKIESLTPRKDSRSPLTSSKAYASPTKSPLRKKLNTPQKTPQRTLLYPQSSVPRNNNNTPGRSVTPSALSPVSLKDFLNWTGISFLTGLSTSRRRETFVIQPVAGNESSVDKEIAKLHAEAFTVPMLEMYQHSCRELTNYIKEGRAMCDEIESDINDQNPELFEQYRRANPAKQRELQAQFKVMKTSARLSAKGVWYVWRENLLKGVLVPLRKNLADLEAQKMKFEEYENAATPYFEQVQAEFNELKLTIDGLVDEEAQYESYDHEEAARLVEQISEYTAQNEVDEQTLAKLQERQRAMLKESDSTKQQLDVKAAEIKALELEAERHRGFTNNEILNLKREQKLLVAKTGLRLQSVQRDQVEVLYKGSLIIWMNLDHSDISVSLPLAPTVAMIPPVRNYYLKQMRRSLAEDSSDSLGRDNLRPVLEQWSAVTALEREVEHLATMYPTTVADDGADDLRITTCVLLPASRTKFLVHFTCLPRLTLVDPIAGIDVELTYGCLDANKVRDHVQSRISKQCIQKKGRGWLLDALKMPEGL